MPWAFPLRRPVVGVTSDSNSFEKIVWTEAVEVPVHPHCGSFGVVRRKHIHEGVDIYGAHGEPVYAVETGKVALIAPFTGPHAGSPWWLDTWCVMIEGASGVVNYGEVTPAEGCDRFLRLTVGSEVPTGALVGTIATVLAKDKGRPTTMLHLELYQRGTRAFAEWAVDAAAPDGVSHREQPPGGLVDPTPHLLAAVPQL